MSDRSYPRMEPKPGSRPMPAPEGSAPEGSTPEGSTPEGSAPEGSAPEGSTPEGSTPEGSARKGPTSAVITLSPGDLAPGWRVAGLPVIGRLGRQLAVRGVRRVSLTGVGGPEAHGWQAVIRRAAPGISVTLASGASSEPRPEAPAAGGDLQGGLQGNALYDDAGIDAWARGVKPAPRFVIARPEDAAEASRWLWRSIRKSLTHDGPIAYALARPVARPVTRVLARLGVAPNAVTGLGLLLALSTGFVAARGGYGAGVVAVGLFFLGLILDCVDGDLARITLSTSRLGQWLDTITDDLAYAALAAGLGVGIARETGDPAWLVAGLGTAALVAVGQSVIYYLLWRDGGPIDTARYPWFFMGEAGLSQSEDRSLFGWLSFTVRRDALTVYFVGLALLGWRWAILSLLAAGAAAYAVLLVVDLGLRAARARAAGGGA